MVLVKNGMIHDMVNKEPYKADILIEDGIIKAIGTDLTSDGEVYDAEGYDVYPGFIDAHAHLGLDGYGIGFEGADYNEMNDVCTPQLRAIDSFNPLDPTVKMAAQAGVTTVATGQGSSNAIGGTWIAVKTTGCCVDDMIVKDPIAMKCALGENPKRCYREKGNAARMTTAANIRQMMLKTLDYMARLEAAGDDPAKKPAFDYKCEAMIPVMKREIPLKIHAHQANDILTAVRLAREFNVKMTLEHTTEGHLIADKLAECKEYPMAVGPTLTHASKFELQNKSWETPKILSEKGCLVSIITDSPVIPQQYLTLCAGLAVKAGMDPYEALKAITINPAKHIGIEDRVGSLEPGKDGDLVVYEGSPFDIDSKVRLVLINGNKID
ncbi:MAG: amidohydrolase [Solobacterium sp.]|jgi:imidazolonepropionase-like amidohydrolase|nr:amidohydrolase [Solobacterium sp.]MBR3343631.1 amidohydrolase [Solobacterium sp.]HAE17496.1 amidohydrolase [Erysipelotrichaceae bacterium]